jgi:hypothetical protein
MHASHRILACLHRRKDRRLAVDLSQQTSHTRFDTQLKSFAETSILLLALLFLLLSCLVRSSVAFRDGNPFRLEVKGLARETSNGKKSPTPFDIQDDRFCLEFD